MAQIKLADVLAELAAVREQLASLQAAPAAPSVASQHFRARDLACTWPTPCSKTFRTAKGVAFHREQPKHAIAK